MNTKEEILSDIMMLRVDCPDCHGLYDDDQYTCTTCWCEGGNDTINVFNWLKDNPETMGLIVKPKVFNPYELDVTIDNVDSRTGYFKLKNQYVNELFNGYITTTEYMEKMNTLYQKEFRYFDKDME